MLNLDQSSDQKKEVLVEDKQEYIVKFSGGSVQGGDDIRFVRKDMSVDNSGNECDNAAFNALSVTSDSPDHGGKVYACDATQTCTAPVPCSGHDFAPNPCSDKGEGVFSSLALDGDVDTVHPLK